jgi:hypothetical protein
MTGWSGYIDPYFPHFGTSRSWVVSFTPRPLYSRGKSPRYPLDRKLGGPQSRSGRRGEEKILALPGHELRLVASRYTDWAIPAPESSMLRIKLIITISEALTALSSGTLHLVIWLHLLVAWLILRKIYNGTVYTTITLKEIKETLLCQHLFLLAVGGNVICFDPFLGSSSGVQEHRY